MELLKILKSDRGKHKYDIKEAMKYDGRISDGIKSQLVDFILRYCEEHGHTDIYKLWELGVLTTDEFHSLLPSSRSDCLGNSVEWSITFDGFQTLFLDHPHCYLMNCHDFTDDGFLFDEGGVYGFDNTKVGFARPQDLYRYRTWLRIFSSNL